MEVRKVKSHVRHVAVIGVWEDNKRIVLGEAAGGAYSSEIKLLRGVLRELSYEDVEAICALGDKGFDAIDVIEEFYHRGITPAVAVKETFRMGVRDELRKKSKGGLQALWER